MKVTIINPTIYSIGNNVAIGQELESLNIPQIEDVIRRCLLSRSIICDKIQIDKKFIKDSDYFKSAQEFLDEVR